MLDPTSAAASVGASPMIKPLPGLYSGASWEQIGNSIGNVSPIRPQYENTKAVTYEPWIRRL